MPVNRQTKYCVYCLESKATSWCGYVLKKKKTVLAGWCSKCKDDLGFVGHYRKEMKAVKET